MVEPKTEREQYGKVQTKTQLNSKWNWKVLVGMTLEIKRCLLHTKGECSKQNRPQNSFLWQPSTFPIPGSCDLLTILSEFSNKALCVSENLFKFLLMTENTKPTPQKLKIICLKQGEGRLGEQQKVHCEQVTRDAQSKKCLVQVAKGRQNYIHQV